MEVYQWLLRRNGFEVNNTGYFVYANGSTENKSFDGKLEFDLTLLPYEGKDDWVEPTIHKIHKCLSSDRLPQAGKDCDYCAYTDAVRSII